MLDLAIVLSGRLLVYLFPERRPIVRKPLRAPLGSLTRPVRARGASGKAMYLARLRGPGGSAPSCRQLPVVGLGVYDNFLELYEVKCGGSTFQIYFEECYEGQTDEEPVPGFTIVDDTGGVFQP